MDLQTELNAIMSRERDRPKLTEHEGKIRFISAPNPVPKGKRTIRSARRRRL